jgi:hypothetical protein
MSNELHLPNMIKHRVHLRKVEFFRWVESVDNKFKKYRQVPLVLTEGNEQTS